MTRITIAKAAHRGRTLILNGARLLSNLAWRAAHTKQPLVGSLESIHFIPARQYFNHIVCGYSVLRIPAWTDPFWSVTVLTEDGEYLHACLDRRMAPPDEGSPVSFVASRSWPWSKATDQIEALLRPDAKVLRV